MRLDAQAQTLDIMSLAIKCSAANIYDACGSNWYWARDRAALCLPEVLRLQDCEAGTRSAQGVDKTGEGGAQGA